MGSTSGSLRAARRWLGGDEREEFLSQLGLTGPLEKWTRFSVPIVEWSTKFEGYDRYLSNQEALLGLHTEARQTAAFCAPNRA